MVKRYEWTAMWPDSQTLPLWVGGQEADRTGEAGTLQGFNRDAGKIGGLDKEKDPHGLYLVGHLLYQPGAGTGSGAFGMTVDLGM